MSVRRFRDVAEMPGPRTYDSKDPALWRRITSWMALSSRLTRPAFPRGVHKNRTIQEANRRREDWRIRAREGRGV